MPTVLDDKLSDIIQLASKVVTTSERIKLISASFLNLPYTTNPLIGSSTTPEEFTFTLKGFDCVTFCETVVAILNSHSKEDFITRLKEIRYKNSNVTWLCRNHYMSNWLKENKKFVESYTNLNSAECYKTLSTLTGYPQQNNLIYYCPLDKLLAVKNDIPDSALVLFVSTKDNLDYFHLGLTIWKDKQLYLRHAAKSIGFVNDELFTDFLKRNTLLGVSIYKIKRL